MDSKLVKDVRSAAKNLVAVAKALRVPLDTSEFERALNALLRDERKAEKEADKPAEDAPKPTFPSLPGAEKK